MNDIIKNSDMASNILKTSDKASDFAKVSNYIIDTSKSIDKASDVIKRTDNFADALKASNNLQDAQKYVTLKRPTPRQSELDFIKNNPNFSSQVSFKNGERVKYGTKSSSRIDAYKNGTSIEIKNYDLSKKQNIINLLNVLQKQYYERLINLPKGTKQIATIDIRGQKIDKNLLKILKKKLLEIYDKVRFIYDI